MSQVLVVLAFRYGRSTTNTKERLAILLVTSCEVCLAVIEAYDQEWQLFVYIVYVQKSNVIGKILHLNSVVQNFH